MLELWEVFYDHMYEFIGAYMFLALALTLFTGLPVAFALGGISVIFGGFAIYFEIFEFNVLSLIHI